ncbi:MAG: GAF domain-containing protein [Anaerolineae bacterium]|nr:GAF domain-containing protein [Anaerolineae bacterium]
MSSPAGSDTIQDTIKQLSSVLNEIIDALRSQRDRLRQRGMGLPPGTLNGFKEVQHGLLGIAEQIRTQGTAELTQLRALAETTALINSSLDVDEVLNRVIDTVIALMGAERGYIALRDETTGQMEFRIARNLDQQTIEEEGFGGSRTIVGHVAETGEPVLTNDAQVDPNFSASHSVVLHALRSILCVPLTVKDKTIGVVYVDNRIKNNVFGDTDLALLIDFANQAAIAIANARLFARDQAALAEITEMKELRDNVFASIASGVVATNEQDTVTTYNVAAEHILQIPYAHVLGTPLDHALPLVYRHVRDLLEVIYQYGTQEILEIDTEVPARGVVNLNLKLTPLKNEEQTEGVTIVVDDLTEIKQRDATLNVVRRYLPPAMVDNIQSIDELGLGGERREITVIFVEARPFGSFPPGILPQELMELLNLYLTTGADAIHNQTGVIDKFMGNEIMGLFNTQLNPSDDHAWLAVQAALKLAEDYLLLPTRIGEDPIPYFRVGIHTGEATMGNVGSATRKEFTAIGHTVNLAKRLQENAVAGTIIISASTLQHCQVQLTDPAHGITVIDSGRIQAKGISQEIPVYEVHRAATR